MSTDTELVMRSELSKRTGTVLGVCYSAELINDVAKEQHTMGQITRLGIPGDRHYGETRYSQSRKQTIANDRPISVNGVEATRDACKKLGIEDVPVGGFGENLLLEGLGDLSDLEQGDRLLFAPDSSDPAVVLEVQFQNPPCSNLKVYHRLMTKEMMGRRGVICTVMQEGTVHVGDKVELVRKNQG